MSTGFVVLPLYYMPTEFTICLDHLFPMDLTAMWEETKIYETRHENKEMEVRREAVGSDRRDESVMGPPQVFSQGFMPRNNHRDIPTGEDAPTSIQAPTFSGGLPSADMQRLSTHNDENREEDITSAQLEASANGNDSNSRGKGKNYAMMLRSEG